MIKICFFCFSHVHTSNVKIHCRLLWEICKIFFTAPVVRFLGKNIHFVLFLLLYTYVGIMLQPDIYRWEEGIMHFWIGSLFLMELRQLSENGLARLVSAMFVAGPFWTYHQCHISNFIHTYTDVSPICY